MRKVIFILLVFTITVSCSLTRRKIYRGLDESNDNSTNLLLNKVIEQNITQNSFFITRAEIEIISENERKEFVASIKFSKPDKYLVSLKLKAGIEAARIFLTSDTILINDRFNRIQYYGSPDKLYKRFGVSHKLMSLILGDYEGIKCVNSDFSICKNDVLNIICNDRSTEIVYEIDCIRNKVKKLRVTNEEGKADLKISFTDFNKINNILLPQQIDIEGIPDIVRMNITIRRIDLPWEGVVEFLPGNRYEKIEIL